MALIEVKFDGVGEDIREFLELRRELPALEGRGFPPLNPRFL